MELRNLDLVENSLKKYCEDEYKHYFVIERPSWDNQHIYYDINYNVESELFFGGYIEIGSLITDDELGEYIEKIKAKYDLPFKKEGKNTC
ncbi:hypothetical protein [Paenibacillus chitinolyticus]|uniref:hypothetical protein n=1 Tax=Paenibacillus chitinolyticus TaxID=79263 RepID=UPI0036724AD9